MFGDNVRARRAARALPRTPIREEEEKEEEEQREPCTPHTTAIPSHLNHHRHSAMTHSCHKTRRLNQQCCDNEHKDGEERRGRLQDGGQDNTKGDRTKTRGHHAPHTTAIQQGHRTNETGDANIKREGQHRSTRPSTSRHPPLQCHPTIHDGHPSTTARGRRIEDTPPHKTTDRHTPPTPHDMATRQQHDRTAVLTPCTGQGGA